MATMTASHLSKRFIGAPQFGEGGANYTALAAVVHALFADHRDRATRSGNWSKTSPVYGPTGSQDMALFVIERNYAEQLQLTSDGARLIKEINADAGVHWLFSFLSADKKKTYCLYEAPSAEAIRDAAQRANLPADVVMEVTEVRPELFT
jgi:hypothetical protein